MFILLLVTLSLADVYSPFKRTAVIQNRINTVRSETLGLREQIERFEQTERTHSNKLHYLYRDLKYATVVEDRTRLELEIEREQKLLHEARMSKVRVLREMRSTADKVTQPFRDNIVRGNKLERFVGVEDTGNYVEQRMRTQKMITKIASKLAKKYATIAASVAAKKSVKVATKKFKGDAEKIKEYVEKKATMAYTSTHSKIVQRIAAAFEKGYSLNVAETARAAIEKLVKKINMKETMIASTENLHKVTDKVLKSQIKQLKQAEVVKRRPIRQREQLKESEQAQQTEN
ncbi:hypothetical protein EIN_095850 [Entamoeba invadens IP1]|uniref:Uncharacterized protein n=1 Tax=Entamoeba invadens IP1 TaxID=370355 RepID=A0A0A1U3L3_ENTIV|nr:hypothetical protein EIN_095850 [Entamoeba invadens IP1]ELP87328.1 hypothetical protein EIN_095850 [Entamoeba invadens IP1]|eukprot:XP_004254099.1 hypothetical protein EIN_095850 [Entamoeba invadens IP1]